MVLIPLSIKHSGGMLVEVGPFLHDLSYQDSPFFRHSTFINIVKINIKKKYFLNTMH